LPYLFELSCFVHFMFLLFFAAFEEN